MINRSAIFAIGVLLGLSSQVDSEPSFLKEVGEQLDLLETPTDEVAETLTPAITNLRASPMVGKPLKIEIFMSEVPGKNMFWAPLYVGSDHIDNYVMYDTMSNMIAVNVKQAQGSVKKTNYTTEKSATAKAIRYDTKVNG